MLSEIGTAYPVETWEEIVNQNQSVYTRRGGGIGLGNGWGCEAIISKT
jgi:hypothetical protein